ncbi:hypothetical protein MCHI_002266 [Candidatus Magnetoovum chiemensis]|nr:hypothetical protein MCHI_002266 [Candidatus Magnetoovum chiemensis]
MPETVKSEPAKPKTTPSPKKRAAKQEETLELRIGQRLILIVGIILMVFGIAYFLKYSFEQGWISHTGRVLITYAWAVLLMTAGDRFIKKDYKTFGLYIFGGGIAAAYYSTFAAYALYHIAGQAFYFIFMVSITLLVSFMSIRYDAKWLSVLGIVGGFSTPILLEAADNHAIIFAYLFLLNMGVAAVSLYKKWDILNTLGFIFTNIVFTQWFFNHYGNSKFWPSLIFNNLVYIIYTIVPFAYHLIQLPKSTIRGMIIITPNIFISFAYNFYMVSKHASVEWVGAVTLFYVLAFGAFAYLLYVRELKTHDVFFVSLSKAMFFLVITVPIILSEQWITIFWAFEALMLLWTSLTLKRKALYISSYVLLAVTIFKFLFFDYFEVFYLKEFYFYFRDGYTYNIAARYTVSLSLLASVFAFAHLLKGYEKSPSRRYNQSAIYTVFTALLFIMLNVELSAFFYDYLRSARFAAISVLWTLFSASLMVIGFIINSHTLRIVSFVLFGITIFKVFVLDMAKFSTPYRIISFMILGIVLILMSYLYHIYKERIKVFLGGGENK